MSSTPPNGHRPRRGHPQQGFTLLEVLVAVAILAISLTSLLGSQMQALRATRYAQQVTAAAFLAEYQLVEIEYQIEQKEDGWGDNDREFEGDFSEQGWPDMTYHCLVDMIEMPDYQAIQAAAQAGDTDGEGHGTQSHNMRDTGEQAFDALGMVWPMVKNAIEQSIRRSSCKVTWYDGKVEHDFEVMTFWTDVSKLDQIQQGGGEAGEEDDTDDGDDAGGGGGGGAGGRGGGSTPSGGRGGGGVGGPQLPPSQRGGR